MECGSVEEAFTKQASFCVCWPIKLFPVYIHTHTHTHSHIHVPSHPSLHPEKNKIKCRHISLACSVINTTRSDMIQGNTIKTQSL